MFGHINGSETSIQDRKKPGKPPVVAQEDLDTFIVHTADNYREEEVLNKNHKNNVTKLVRARFKNKFKTDGNMSSWVTRFVRKPLQEEYAKRKRKSSVEADDTSKLKNVEEL